MTRRHLALFCLLLIGISSRLSHGLHGSVWRDEAQLLNVVGLDSSSTIVDFLVNHESHPPLFYLLMKWWSEIAGPDVRMAIAPGIVFGAATILLAWWIGGTAGTRLAGWVAGILIALSPRLIESDSTARPYSLVTLALLLATVSMWRALATGSTAALAGWSVASIVLLYLHNWTVLPVAATGAIALWFVLSRRSSLTLRPLLLAGIGVLLAWLPWLPRALHQARHGGQLLPETSPLIRAPIHLLTSVPGLTIEAGVVLAAGLLCLLLLRKRGWAPPEPPPGWLPLTGAIVILTLVLATIGSFRTNLLVPHVLPMLAPLVLISVAILVTAPASQGRLLAWTTLILVVCMTGRDALRVALSPRSNADRVARRISLEARPQDLVVLLPADVVSSFERAYDGRAPLFGFPEGSERRPIEYDDRVARESNPEVLTLASDRMERTLQSGGRIWEVSVGVEPHLVAPWITATQRLRALGGTPVEILDSSPRVATLEQMRIRVWSRQD